MFERICESAAVWEPFLIRVPPIILTVPSLLVVSMIEKSLYYTMFFRGPSLAINRLRLPAAMVTVHPISVCQVKSIRV